MAQRGGGTLTLNTPPGEAVSFSLFHKPTADSADAAAVVDAAQVAAALSILSASFGGGHARALATGRTSLSGAVVWRCKLKPAG